MLGAAITILVTLVLALFVMSLLFSRHIERRAADELRRDGLMIIAAMRVPAAGAPLLEGSLADPRYDQPAGGRYWQMSSAAGQSRSVSLWDEQLSGVRATAANDWTVRETNGPFHQRIMIIERTVIPADSGTPVKLAVAQNIGDLRVARNEFRRELGLFLIALWVLLVAAAWIQVHLGLRPLARIRQAVQTMRQSPSARLDQRYPLEVAPLTSAINELAEAREKDLLRARRRAADLAHSLKTPLAAMSALSRKVRTACSPALSDDLNDVIGTAGAALEAELARSRAASIRDRQNASYADPNQVAERIVAVVGRTDRGAQLVYTIAMQADMRVPVAEDDLMEVLGALIENATRFGRRHVVVGGLQNSGEHVLTVEDDGKGLDISVEEALSRGGRLDEAGAGNHGLGLSIARDIVEATGGALHLQRSDLGGLKVMLRWKNSRPALD